ncbi:MAG: sensor histidine kinase [Eubacteriales bacterium]|nr:sensor histidine kinase [Eubacteriales bacterium]
MVKWYSKITHWKFDKKMQLLVTVAITLTTLLFLAISTVSSITSMKRQSMELLQSQNSTVSENIRSSLDRYKTAALATIMDSSVQTYAREAEKKLPETTVPVQNAYNVLSSILNMHSDLNFIAIVGAGEEDYVYKGRENLSVTKFTQVYREDYEASKTVGSGTIRMCYNNAYYGGKRYTLNVYFPIYDTGRIFRELGLLCLNFTNAGFQQILEYEGASDMETVVVDTDGMLVASRNTENIGSQINYMEDIQANPGTFTKDGNMYIYQKVKNWNFYVVSIIPTIELYKSSIHTIIVITLILLVLVVASTKVLQKIIKRVYQPLDKVINKMDDVASGSLKTRIDVENMGEDFSKLAVGFNSMMDEIQILMEQVKQEQHQIEQQRFNALQSQIQPHFLYNTLECIHWQAIADGNKEISTLVKALAKYYRICLSKGRDVITLGMELEHVRNYLIIQNMRYDNIIGSEFDIDSSVEDAMIPKLTLQPLVENSIYHGMKLKEGKKGTLFITAKRDGEDVLITVSDTGTGMNQQQIDEMNQHLSEYEDSFGYGVRNVNKRIELLYGKGFGLFYLKNESGGVTVKIRIPYVTEVKDNILGGGQQTDV